MYVPRGYERYFNRYHHFTPSPIPDNVMLARPPWGGTVYAAGQSITIGAPSTTVQQTVDSAAVPLVLLSLAGFAVGGYFAYGWVRKTWGGR